MGQTPIYGLRFPQPGQSNNVPRDMRNLAEDVEAQLARIDTTSIADLQTRMTAVEAAVAAARWRRITSGFGGGGDKVLTVPGGFSRLRLTLTGNMDTTSGFVALQVNEDATAGRHRYGQFSVDATGALQNPVFDQSEHWSLVQWGVPEGNEVTVDIFPADGGSQAPAFRASGHREGGSGGVHERWFSWGRYSADAVVSSLKIIDVGTSFGSVRWWLDGFLA